MVPILGVSIANGYLNLKTDILIGCDLTVFSCFSLMGNRLITCCQEDRFINQISVTIKIEYVLLAVKREQF